ncbi:sensor histidine kinase [Streptomyces phaeofaciens]|uniref:sensor histidine kinase n=1 Tax=Streptomyces phaeofaciens TaxID=68254 RepID=UPI003689DA52
MSTKEVDAPARSASSAPSARRGLRGFADRWPFQRKLNALVGIPLTVIALLLTYLIVDLVQESNRAESAAQLVRDSAQVAHLVAELQDEHQQAILLSVRHQAAFDGGTPSTDAYRQAQLAVDDQVQKVVDTFDDRLPDTEAQALREIQGLAGLRSTIEQGFLPADNIDPAYSGAAKALIDGLGLDRNSNLATTFTGNLLDSLLRADAAHGAYETGVFSARTGDSNALIEFTGAVGSYEVYQYQAERFARFATESQNDRLGGIEHNASQASISQHFAELSVDPSALQAESRAQTRAAFRAALASYPEYSAQSATRLKITTSLIDEIADRADETATSAEWRAGLLLNLALLCFALWIAFAIMVRRSVVRPVLALTGAAQEVADIAGRELARVADDDAEESGPPQLRELPVTADDEIGELAEAFNNVQTTAAALLERQVLSRRNVAEMFGNVGRRVSNLTTRQLALIDAVERGETDPALLERLYSIDHIAVRLRRNADSLMLLAGIRETVLDSGPTALTNVVRAALGQIEGFQRVQLYAGTEAMVEPDIIGDLTLMIAELLENAVSFSPEGSTVEVAVDSGDHGATITVADHGLGMSTERLAEENARLVRRERLDVVPTKVLGLFVVGALARRWDIDVTLARTPGGGVTSEVTIPSALLLTLSAMGVPADASAPAALPVPSAPAAGPSPASSVTPEAGTSSAEESVALPRRVPRRDQPATAENEHTESTENESDGTDPSVPADATADQEGAPRATPAEPEPEPARRDVTSLTDATRTAPGAGTPGRTTQPVRSGAPAVPTPRASTEGSSARTGAEGARADADTGARTATEVTGHARTPEPASPGRTAGPPAPLGRTAEPASPNGGSPNGDAFATGSDGARPLRRRVRGATLRTTVDAAQQAARQPARPADADAVRSALEEFEEAVERAHRDSGGDTGEHPSPTGHHRTDGPSGRSDQQNQPDQQNQQDQNHLPEGAEQ